MNLILPFVSGFELGNFWIPVRSKISNN